MNLSEDFWQKMQDMLRDRAERDFDEMFMRAAGVDFSNVRYRGQRDNVTTSNLPPGHWSNVLGVSQFATAMEIKTAYRKLARSAHPDAGGSVTRMARLNAARDAALKEVTR